MKNRFISVLLILALCMGLAACSAKSDKPAETGKDQIGFSFTNSVKDEIDVLTVSMLVKGEAIGTTGVEVAGGGGNLGQGPYTFYLNKEDLKTGVKTSDVTVQVTVRNEKGVETNIAQLKADWSFGAVYCFEIKDNNGAFCVDEVK